MARTAVMLRGVQVLALQARKMIRVTVGTSNPVGADPMMALRILLRQVAKREYCRVRVFQLSV
jgi:hypothetical protein